MPLYTVSKTVVKHTIAALEHSGCIVEMSNDKATAKNKGGKIVYEAIIKDINKMKGSWLVLLPKEDDDSE